MTQFIQLLPRSRPVESNGAYSKLHGEFALSTVATGLTTVAAATATAGHVFAMRWSSSTGKLAVIRYLKLDFLLTTAFGAAQAVGFDVIGATGYTASHTGGTAVDCGSTVTTTNKRRQNQDTSLFAANAVRIGGAGALTAGTHTLHANPFAQAQGWMGAVGASLSATLLDARDDSASTCRSPITLKQDEGLIVRNTILMGATGVGNLVVTCEWDEVTL